MIPISKANVIECRCFPSQGQKEAGMHRWIVLPLMAGFAAGCGPTANVEQERETLMRLDREWAASLKDMDKFMSYYTSDASLYPPGMPLATGSRPIRDVLTKMSSTPGSSVEFGP